MNKERNIFLYVGIRILTYFHFYIAKEIREANMKNAME